MITYVNTVLVSNKAGATIAAASDSDLLLSDKSGIAAKKGDFVIINTEGDKSIDDLDTVTHQFKIGMYTGEYDTVIVNGTTKYAPRFRWTNEINPADVKSVRKAHFKADSQDTVEIDLTSISSDVATILAEGGKRVVVRLTFKDMPTRYRKWTESYEYVTVAGDTYAEIAAGLAEQINKQYKRARVIADGTTTSGKLVLTAMEYDDDNSSESINWAGTVRFNANVYFTDPSAAGFASKNKYFPTGAVITKTPGQIYLASPKLVRDRESQAMGYLGILNRGECTWPIIKPAVEADIAGEYDAYIIEFENMYRAADDIFRKTKQTVEIYCQDKVADAIDTALTGFVGAALVEPINGDSGE
jgi:hypothetical protein